MTDMKRLRNRILSLLLVVLWCGLIFGASAQNGKESGALSGMIVDLVMRLWGLSSDRIHDVLTLLVRKGAHMSEYAILLLLLLWLLSSWTSLRGVGLYSLSLGIAVIFAASDEYHQTFVDGRAGSVRDVVIDSCGAVLMLGLVLIVRRLLRRNTAAPTGES